MFTLAQIASFQDGAILPGPVSGTVKQAFEVKTHPEYGQSQGFILADSTGEVSCFLGADDKVPFAPVKRGDQLEIAPALNGKGQLSGVKKGTYNNKPQLKIYDNRFVRNLSSPAATQPASYGQPTQQATPNPAPAQDRPSTGVTTARNGKMTEEEARDCFLANELAQLRKKMTEREAVATLTEVFYDLAKGLGFRQVDHEQGWASAIPPAYVPVIGAWATSILIGRQKGDILPDPEPQQQTDYGAGDRHAPRQQTGRVDPPWMSDDGEGEP